MFSEVSLCGQLALFFWAMVKQEIMAEGQGIASWWLRSRARQKKGALDKR
jgi:hypothetical protein